MVSRGFEAKFGGLQRFPSSPYSESSDSNTFERRAFWRVIFPLVGFDDSHFLDIFAGELEIGSWRGDIPGIQSNMKAGGFLYRLSKSSGAKSTSKSK